MNTITNLPSPLQIHFDRTLLSVPVPNMIHTQLAMKFTMPQGEGLTYRKRRYNPLDTALVPLGPDGVTPPGQNLTAVDIDATMQWYGTYIQLHEQCTLTNADPKMNGVFKSSLIDLEAYGIC